MHCQGLAPGDVELLRWNFFLAIESGDESKLDASHHPALLTLVESNGTAARLPGDSETGRADEPGRTIQDPIWRSSADEDRLAWGPAVVRFSRNGPSHAYIGATGGQRSALLPTAFSACASRALAVQGKVLLHGASFLVQDRCVLVAGPRCAGKSTLTAAALAASCSVLSDDSVVCWRDGGVPILAPFRTFLSFREKTLVALPPPVRRRLYCSRGPDEERWLLGVDPSLAGRAHPVAVLWLARVDKSADVTVIKRLDDARALAGLINSVSVLFMTAKYPREAAALTRVLVATVEHTPSFEVVLGRDVLLDPANTLWRLAEVSL